VAFFVQSGEWINPVSGAQEINLFHGTQDEVNFGWKYK
jgi:hypothetical protein